MSQQYPDPPYPADTRAKGWRFELDYEQIEQSDTWPLAAEVPMAQHALLMMWMVAWAQTPCGSFPADHEVIRAKCRIPAAMWAKCKAVLLRGWWQANDGRLYHDTLIKRVGEMMGRRRSDSDRKAAQRAKDAAGIQPGPADVPRDKDVTPVGVRLESSTDNRLPTNTSPSLRSGDARATKPGKTQSDFQAFYAAYPKKRAPGDAEKAFAKVDAPLTTLLAAIEAQKATEDWRKEGGKFIPYPATWLNQKQWLNETAAPSLIVTAPRGPDPALAKIAADAARAAAPDAETRKRIAALTGRVSHETREAA
jgi:hypothetical protein